MENEKREDLRVRRTRKLLCGALFDLLEEKSVEDISIVEICDRALVHRATFYKHFEDKNGFLEFAAREKLRELYKDSLRDLGEKTPAEKLHAIVLNMFIFTQENRSILKPSVTAVSGSTFFSALAKILSEELEKLLFYCIQQKYISEDYPVAVGAHYLSGGFISVLKWWLMDDIGYTPEEMTDMLEEMFRRNECGSFLFG